MPVKALEKACTRTNIALDVDSRTSGQNIDPAALFKRYRSKQDAMERYITAYREYCWTVDAADDFRIAPFHILACENRVFSQKKHTWHMKAIRKYITGIDSVFMETPYICVDTDDEESVKSGVDWWLKLTDSGGEGMESLTRFVQNAPLYKVHECSFGVLAFESEPVDPRLQTK